MTMIRSFRVHLSLQRPFTLQTTGRVPSPVKRHLLASTCCIALMAGCGDDFSATDTSTNEAASFEPLPTQSPTPPRPTPPSPATSNTGVTSTNTTMAASSDVTADDAGARPPMLPPEGPGAMPGTECGGDGEPCCDADVCRRGFTCSATSPTALEADAAMAPICQRELGAQPAPELDAAPPGPPEMPSPDGDGGLPPKPPAPGGDAGPPAPPHMPAEPEGDAGPKPPKPDVECGAAGEICCKGPGGRCDDGLECVSPNGRDLTDSECVAAP